MAGPIVLSLGSVNADFQIRVERYPEPGETLPGRDFMRLGGGKAANVALLARRLGARSLLLARVGDDALCEQALSPLREAGVDLTGVSVARGAPTGLAMIFVPPDGKKGIILATNANDEWSNDAADAVARAVSEAPRGSVLVADLEVPVMVVRRAMKAAEARGLPAVLDPSPADRLEEDLMARATVVTPNAAEAKSLTGITVDGPDAGAEAARRLARRGPKHPCVKLPDGGCVVHDGGRTILVPPLPAEVVDTTGSGDAFAGAFAVALTEGRPLREAAGLAVAAASLSVRGYGSQPAYPDRDRLDEAWRSLADGIHEL